MTSKNSTQSELPVIDLILGAKIMGGTDMEAAKAIVAQLVDMLPGDLDKMKRAFEEKDNQKLKNMAYYVKDSSIHCGTPRLSEAATELYDSLNVNADSAAIAAAFKKFSDEVEAVLTEYAKIKK